MTVHILILEIGNKVLQFFLHVFSYMPASEIVRSQAEISLCCESWLWYLKNGAFEVIETLLDLIFWLLFLLVCLSDISVDVFSLNSKPSNVSCSKGTAVNSC